MAVFVFGFLGTAAFEYGRRWFRKVCRTTEILTGLMGNSLWGGKFFKITGNILADSE